MEGSSNSPFVENGEERYDDAESQENPTRPQQPSTSYSRHNPESDVLQICKRVPVADHNRPPQFEYPLRRAPEGTYLVRLSGEPIEPINADSEYYIVVPEEGRTIPYIYITMGHQDENSGFPINFKTRPRKNIRPIWIPDEELEDISDDEEGPAPIPRGLPPGPIVYQPLFVVREEDREDTEASASE